MSDTTKALPWHQRIIGELEGRPVIGTYWHHAYDAEHLGRPEGVRWEIDPEIGTLGVDLAEDGSVEYLHINVGPELDPAEWATVQGLLAGGILEQLTTIARQHHASPRLPINGVSAAYVSTLVVRGMVAAERDGTLSPNAKQAIDVAEVLGLLPLMLATDDDELLAVLLAQFEATPEATRQAAGAVLEYMHRIAEADCLPAPRLLTVDEQPDPVTDDAIALLLRRALGEEGAA
jgi:hypothetical protein